MGAFELIEKKQYEDFCRLYLDKVDLRQTSVELSDLMPGNYILALVGLQDYEELIKFSLEQVELKRQESAKYDMSVSINHIALSIGYLGCKNHTQAIQAIRGGLSATYQDITRTQVPCIMYYEAVIFNDKQAKQESKKVLNLRLRSKNAPLVEFATARFLSGKCSEEEMLQQIDLIENITLKYRYKVQALFYSAVKAFENGEYEKCTQTLLQVRQLYDECTIVTIQIEYHLAENWLKGGVHTSMMRC